MDREATVCHGVESDGTDDVEIYTVTSESTEREVEVTAYLEETDGTPIPDDIIPYVQQLVDCLGFIGNIPFVQQLVRFIVNIPFVQQLVRFIVNIPYVQQLVAQSETLLVPAAVAAPNLDPYDTSGWDDEQSDKELYIHANKVAGSVS